MPYRLDSNFIKIGSFATMILACLQLSVRALIALVATACFIECGCADDALVNALTKAQLLARTILYEWTFRLDGKGVGGQKVDRAASRVLGEEWGVLSP